MTRLDDINLYRKRAAEMEILAAETRFPAMRDSYLHLAEEWKLLADGLERRAGDGWTAPEGRSFRDD